MPRVEEQAYNVPIKQDLSFIMPTLTVKALANR